MYRLGIRVSRDRLATIASTAATTTVATAVATVLLVVATGVSSWKLSRGLAVLEAEMASTAIAIVPIGAVVAAHHRAPTIDVASSKGKMPVDPTPKMPF